MHDYDPNDAELRLQCVRESTVGGIADLRRAAEIYRFVTGQSDRTPKEAILAALERAGVS